MNENKIPRLLCIKYALLTSLVFCIITIYGCAKFIGRNKDKQQVYMNGREVHHIGKRMEARSDVTQNVTENAFRARTYGSLYQKLLTTSFPYEIRNNWPEPERGALAIYILSAIGSNTTNHAGYERDVKLHGWLGAKDLGKSIKCCFLWIDGTISEFHDPVLINKPMSSLVGSQIACPFNASLSGVSGVTVQSARATCPSADDKMYIKPYLPKKADDEDSFAICLKVVYGNVDNTLFIDWLEFYRIIGVDKIFMFTYNITEATNAIVRQYVQIGLVEKRPFDHPRTSKRRVGEDSSGYFEDEHVMMYDCLQRSSGYKYMSIVDMDEFLLPRKHGNIKDLMKYLMKTKPTAAGFHLSSYIFVKDVKPDPGAPTNGSDIVKYFQRTKEMFSVYARRKNILLTSRLNARGLSTHFFKPFKHYTSEYVNSSIAAINHYRHCYRSVKKYCSGELITDRFILKFVENFKKKSFARPMNSTDLGNET